MLQRAQVRDFLDVVALADRLERPAEVLAGMDAYYRDRSRDAESVATALAVRLADPRPRDERTIADLPRYKGLDARWHDWATIVEACRRLADGMMDVGE